MSFRDLKHTIGATNFHSKKTKFVTLELWSRLILYNFCSIIILHVPIKHKNRKHEYQINFSLAMKICFDFLRDIALPDIESLISKYILPIRLERNYARQHRVQNQSASLTVLYSTEQLTILVYTNFEADESLS